FRSIRIRTFYNSLVTLPNSNLISSSVDNYGARRVRRWSTKLGIAYDTPPAKIEAFCEGIRELIRQHPATWKDSFQVWFNSFGESALEVLLYVFFEVPDWGAELAARHRLGLDILRLGEALGVEFAFPTRTVWLHRVEAGTEAEDGELPTPAAAGPEAGKEAAVAVLAENPFD
ncbi:MAG TPA: mechanosensitive ion channel domain-containing protein, partial [Thermoanaerobaculia bacterium]|nr:mechanosensitive ion channel domain-containing protein [Thermoanaerobaculia bacterium]